MKNSTLSLSTLILFALALFSLSFASGAQTNPSDASSNSYVDADYVSFFSGDFIKSQGTKALDQLFQNLNYSVEQLNIGTSPTVNLNQIQIHITPQSYQINDTSNGISFQSTGNAVSISLGSISVNQVIQENIGGVIANIQVNASCQGVQIQLTDANSVISGDLSPFEDGNNLKIQLSNPVVSLGTPQFSLSALQCTGAQGFEQIISATIQTSLQNSNLLTSLIQTNVIASVQQAMTQVSYNWTAPQLLFSSPLSNGMGGISAWLYPQSLSQLKAGSWQSYGTVRFTLPFNSGAAPVHVPLSRVDYSSFAGQNIFAVSQDAVTILAKNYFSPGLWSYQGLANSISGFASLLKSRFLQFFVWGDLLNWSENTQFPVSATTSTAAALSWNQDGSLALQTQLRIDMIPNQMPYVTFQIPLKANLSFSIANNNVILQPSKADISINYKFDADYCKQGGFGRCAPIATSIITSSVQSYMDKESFQFPLPVLQIVGGTTVKATSLERRPDLKSFVITFGQ